MTNLTSTVKGSEICTLFIGLASSVQRRLVTPAAGLAEGELAAMPICATPPATRRWFRLPVFAKNKSNEDLNSSSIARDIATLQSSEIFPLVTCTKTTG
ncbi:hypothetical protein ACQVP2_18150 [Methylobacterium aquaticum]|uniref:hypothetical protein n=1 Tax=Methylobacterium aquaticum TaxID=270351 RepID=UPI0018CCA934